MYGTRLERTRRPRLAMRIIHDNPDKNFIGIFYTRWGVELRKARDIELRRKLKYLVSLIKKI